MMLMTRLREYADERPCQPPPLYASTPVAAIVMLDARGRPVSPQPVSRIDVSTARGRRGLEMIAPEVQRAYGIKPLLLADNSEYTFGRARDPEKQDRVDRAHAAYIDLLGRCAVATGEPAVLAVKRFYELGGAGQLDLGEAWNDALKVTFEVLLDDGTRVRPIDLPAVQAFWLAVNMPGADGTDQCLVCGESKPVLDRLQAKVKGIRGGQTSGTSIVSANAAAFESYGLSASRTAPTCRECAESFTRGLNDLLSAENTHLVVGNATFVFWTREDAGFDLASFLHQPDPADVRTLLESARKGRRASLRSEAAFYALALSASGGRAVVRDWIDTTVGRVESHVARWFRLQRVADPRDGDSGEVRPLSLFQLVASTVRAGAATDAAVTTPRALFRAALSGAPIPLEVAYQAVRRCRAERGVTRPRAALIKLVLLSRERGLPREDYMVALETEHPSPAYQCGRLLAVIEEVQRAALPGAKATIVDRYYGAASSTPAVVFGALLRGAQPHLTRLERDGPGAYVNLQRRLEEVMSRIGEWPTTLALREQALFSLGYYHQRAHDRAQAISRRASRDDGADTDDAAEE